MKLNPELRRYAWLELTVHRLVAVPLVIAALATLLVLAADRPAEPLAGAAMGLFILATVVWGSLRTIASVTLNRPGAGVRPSSSSANAPSIWSRRIILPLRAQYQQILTSLLWVLVFWNE